MATKTSKAFALDEHESAELETKLREAKEELFNLRFQAATGQLENNTRLRTVKKDIARIYTVIRERELGIRADVAATSESDDTAEATSADVAENEKDGAA